MSYHVYRTEAFLVGLKPHGEGSLFAQLYTKDFGLVSVFVQSGREIRSKHRYHLQLYSRLEITMVRGREKWRLTGVRALHENRDVLKNKERRIFLAKVFSLVKRLVAGESQDISIFSNMERIFEFIGQSELSERELVGGEIVFVLRLLKSLGYLGEEKKFLALVGDDDFDGDVVDTAYEGRKSIVESINNSLKESQL